MRRVCLFYDFTYCSIHYVKSVQQKFLQTPRSNISCGIEFLKMLLSLAVLMNGDKLDPDIQSSSPEGVFRNASLNCIRPTIIKPYNFDGCFGSYQINPNTEL